MDGMEIFTTTDKDRRDQIFENLRLNGDALEKQVVKFSGNEPHPLKSGQFISTWSVAYPKFASEKKRRGKGESWTNRRKK